MRQFLITRGIMPVLPDTLARKRLHPFDAIVCKQRNRIARMFSILKDWRRIATRWDKRAADFAAGAAIAAIITWCC